MFLAPRVVALAALLSASTAPGRLPPPTPSPPSSPSTATQSDQRRASAGFTLTVHLSGARNDKGKLAVGLFASKDGFPRSERALRGSMLRIQGGNAVATFRGLEPGVYAIAVLHDENSNSKMDFNFLGMPKEGYGFSNDAPVAFGPPSFESAAFKLLPRHSRVPVRVRYFL